MGRIALKIPPMRRSSSSLLLPLLLLFQGPLHGNAEAVAPTSGARASVKGVLRFEGVKSEARHLYYQGRTAATGPVIDILISGRALSPELLGSTSKLQKAEKRDGFLVLSVVLKADGEMEESYLIYPGGNVSKSSTFHPRMNGGQITGGRITNRNLDEPSKEMAEEYDVEFELGHPVDATWRGSSFYAGKPSGLAASAASGWVDSGGTKAPLRAAEALPEMDPFGGPAPRKVLLTAEPLPAAALASALPEAAIVASGKPFLILQFDGQGGLTSAQARAGKRVLASSGADYGADIAFGPGAVDGSAAFEGRSDPDFPFPAFEVKFHAPLRPALAEVVTKTNGQSLPPDGGAPGKAFLQFLKSVQKARKYAEVEGFLSGPGRALQAGATAEEQNYWLEFVRSAGGTGLTVQGGFANATQATVSSVGKEGGTKISGRVHLRLEKGQWKVERLAFRDWE